MDGGLEPYSYAGGGNDEVMLWAVVAVAVVVVLVLVTRCWKEGVYGGPNADPLNETVWGGIVASTPYSHYRDNYGNNQGRRVCV